VDLSKKIIFIGHVSKDINIIKNKEQINPGGGVFYGSFVAKSYNMNTYVYTKANLKDRYLFKEMEEYGIKVIWFPSKSTTSIKNIMPSDNPDERVSLIIEKGDPFDFKDIKDIKGDIIHITPLWHGEIPEELIKEIRKNTKVLGLDAQGFLRNVDEKGSMVYKDWEKKTEFLPLIDVFKVDSREAEILTEEKDFRKALNLISKWGPKEILLTHKDGVMLWVEGEIYEERFGEWTLEGRTGRGDTCMSAYLIHRGLGYETALRKAAEITTEKMKKSSPFKIG
jgi:sugar/nucleoside kinase (ribokinase family)